MDYIQLHANGTPVPLNQRVAGRTFPASIEYVIMRALSKTPDERFDSAAAFAASMQSILEGSFSQSVAPTARPVAQRVASEAPRPLLPASATAPGSIPTTPAAEAHAARPVVAARTLPREPSAASARPLMAAAPPPALARAARANLPFLCGVALAFLVIGAGLALLLTHFVLR
jgi:serine/threonine-protein kinase